MHVPFVDLAAEHAHLADELGAAFRRVLSTNRFVLGPEVEAFESALAEVLDCRFVVGVSSGTDALLCALTALGVGPGDEVITAPFTFVATAEAILRRGALVRFADVSERSLTLDPERVLPLVSVRTRAVVPVHLYGQLADLDRLRALDVALIEDSAQALGSSLRGRKAGTWGEAGCFSFFPSKVVGALGDAGSVVTSDPKIAERVRWLRQHGASALGQYSEVGGNFRLDALQAAFLAAKLPRLGAGIAARRARAARYSEQLADQKGLRLPEHHEATEPNWSLYTVRVLGGRRDALAEFLSHRNIETRVYYRRPLHLQPAFRCLGYDEGDFPIAERASREVLSLPIHPGLTPQQQDHVIDSMRAFFRG